MKTKLRKHKTKPTDSNQYEFGFMALLEKVDPKKEETWRVRKANPGKEIEELKANFDGKSIDKLASF